MSARLPPSVAASAAAPSGGRAVRWFGRWQLLRLVGKSERCMAWRVADPRHGQELLLVVPRSQPQDPFALETWHAVMRQASRVSHPHLASPVEVGVQDGWPFAAYDPRDAATLAERSTAKGWPANEAAGLSVQALRGLAFAHEAGAVHHDLQPWLMLVGDSGQLRLAGLGVAAEVASRDVPSRAGHDTLSLAQQRQAAERDVLALGVVLHGLLAGAPALDEPDVGQVIQRLPPLGREIVRLPWSTAHAVPEALRAIVNRATERQERQRYRSARTLLGTLENWLRAEGEGGGGALALLADRLRSAGVLPSAPGAAARAARLALMERERTNELAEVVLEDPALSFELLRLVNTAQVRGSQVSGSGPVLTVRRAIAMLGLDGVRRAALALREWPGPLGEASEAPLRQLIERGKRAARAAVQLRPAGYDAEVVYLVALLQNLGRLVLAYHFADEAQQMRRLMQPGPPVRDGDAEEPGMPEQAAAFAVLGVDVEALGNAVARHWGLDEAVLALIRRLPVSTPVRLPEGDDDWIRLAASCANEAVEAGELPPQRQLAALQRVAQRYGRALDLTLRDLQAALAGQEAGRAEPIARTDVAPLDTLAAAPPGQPRPTAGGLRRAAAARAAGSEGGTR